MATKAAQRNRPIEDELGDELLSIRSDNAEVYARDDQICSKLKAIAKTKGDNFKVTIENLGEVNVSAPKGKHRTGTAPTLKVDAFFALSEAKRQKLIDAGLVEIAEVWKKAYYGGVTAKLFPRSAP